MAIVNLVNLGINYMAVAQTESGQDMRRDLLLAQDYLERGDRLSVTTKNTVYEGDIQEGLANIQQTEGHYQAALEHYKRFKTNTVLVHLNDELSAANKVKAKFFAILSHDLRSPIAGLLNFLQLQKRKPGSMTTAEIAEYWDKVGGSASALLETMETMLLWSKGQMEHFKPRIVLVEVAELFARAGAVVRGKGGGDF